MADLDDFFAKKDRKKSKSKKFATADELAKKLEDTKQKSDVRPKKDRPAQEGDESGRTAEEEWKEYEEPVKDYTGLKIQVLQGGNGAPESAPQSEDSAPEGGKVKGPWNKPKQAEQQQVEPPPPQQPKPPVVEEKEKAYVPPGRMRAAAEPVPRRNQSKHAPDIHNDDYFPVLGAAGGKRGGGWSTAGGAGATSQAQPRSHQRQPLALGNRFTTLQDDS
ncbi:protein CDV3 homolog isoform X2 [Hyposmocoma kahamanoa]|uniref:protein CDV3 homolog isoform X2 n=1 Tax=Hyposmocoma kahamanoa TaxID=1477025 RepID=UPI000E6D621D|nr:protein CDV3 homolog isoform X2 [Hyposmocoma kahamanoa]